jgi:hypothetical protein
MGRRVNSLPNVSLVGFSPSKSGWKAVLSGFGLDCPRNIDLSFMRFLEFLVAFAE